MQTEQAINVLEIRDEITLENRICTLGQAEVYMKAVESFVEDMNTPERARDSCPVYKADKDEWKQIKLIDSVMKCRGQMLRIFQDLVYIERYISVCYNF